MINKYDKLHQEIIDELGITLRDVKFFRCSYFHNCPSIELLTKKIQDRLPRLKMGKSWRYPVYLKRLSFLSKITDEQFKILIKKLEQKQANE